MTTAELFRKPLGDLSLTQYYRFREFRLVLPYTYTFETRSKPRFHGKSVSRLYADEFSFSPEYLGKAIALGTIRVNGERVDADRVLVKGDVVSHKSHRHEPPVVFKENVVLGVELDGIVLVNKPASMPVHPSGAYRFNTVLFMMAKMGLGELFTIHRLDRLTSGLVLFAKTAKGAQRISNAIQGREGLKSRKAYVAKVRGRFPGAEEQWTRPVNCPESNVVFKEHGWVSVYSTIALVDAKKGVHENSAEGEEGDSQGKSSESSFILLEFDHFTNTSLVKAEPITGRTHQLRLHLQLMGHPIVNDPNYGTLFGETTAASNELKFTEQELKQYHEGVEIATNTAMQTFRAEYPNATEEGPDVWKQICSHCAKPYEPLRNLEIYLHAVRFRVLKSNPEQEGGADDSVESDYRAPFPHWMTSEQTARSNELFWRD